jgi:hypothetical protein
MIDKEKHCEGKDSNEGKGRFRRRLLALRGATLLLVVRGVIARRECG